MGFEWVGREQQRLSSKMRLSLVSSVLVASMVQAAPGASSYGGPAKQIASPQSIQCRTEYVTLWDTEYQEREEQVCKTVYEKQCSTRTSASRSTGQNTNPTPNLSAPLSTSRIANLNGGVMATTRCGLRLRELARMFPTTSARRSPRPTPSRLLTRSARTFPSRSAFLFLARSASPSPTRFAPASPSQNVR